MAKQTQHGIDPKGRVVIFTPTRAQRKSTKSLIPATPAPKTRWQKIVRAAVG